MAVTDIIKIFGPSVVLDDIAISDQEKGTDQFGTTDSRFKQSEHVGATSPFVVINGMNFDKSMIESYMLDLSDFLPRLSCSLVDTGGALTSKYYPMDGDILSTYIKSKNNDYKPIRLDFTILSIKSSPGAGGEGGVYSLECILRVTSLFIDYCKSFKDKTSFDVIKDIAKEIKLGFASNITSTDDKMTWLCAFDTYNKFISDVIMHSYKDDKSFMTCFVDEKYCINFVEVNAQFTLNRDVDITTSGKVNIADYEGGSPEPIKDKRRLIITNSRTEQDTPNYIESYVLVNNSGSINLMNGYRRYLQYYDRETREFIEEFVDTLNSEDTDGLKLLKGREDEDHKARVKYKFAGTQSENVHANYQYAKVNNYQNILEIGKMGMVMQLPEFNPLLYRYQSIPVVIFHYYNEIRGSITNETGDKSPNGSIDLFLSGWYVIKEMKLIWDKNSNRIQHQIFAVKREWDKPKNL